MVILKITDARMTNSERCVEYWEDFIKKVVAYLNLEGSIAVLQVAEEAKIIPIIRKGVAV